MELLYKILTAVATIILTTILNVFICFSAAAVVIIQMLSHGYDSTLSLISGICIAISVQAYIIFNHKLYALVKKLTQKQGNETNEQQY